MIQKRFLPAFFWIIFLLILTLLPGNYIPPISSYGGLFSPDKIIHFFLFSILFVFIIFALDKQYFTSKQRRKLVLFTALFCILFGGITEILQGVMNIGRNASIYDFIADIIGVLLGIIFAAIKIYK